jgi:peptidase C39-like protein
MSHYDERMTVDIESARRYSQGFVRVITGFDHEISSGEITVGPEPLEVFDLSGVPLFYDFTLLAGGEAVGHVRAAADRRVAAAVVALERRPRRWDAGEALRQAVERAQADNPQAEVARESARVVCYSYPKLAIQVGYVHHEGRPGSKLYDVASGEEVPVGGLGGQVSAFPYLARFTDVEARASAFEDDAAALEEAAEVVLHIPPLPPILIFKGQVWLAPECQDILAVPLLGQITSYNCVPASAEMILDHYGWNYSQDEISQAMGTSAANNGTFYNPGVVQGIATLTKNSMTPAEPDTGWTHPAQWDLMVSEIDANRPLFTQMPHHYRVCVGYSQVLVMQFLHIHDPWPPNTNVCQGGADYWENWSGTQVEWFVTLTH